MSWTDPMIALAVASLGVAIGIVLLVFAIRRRSRKSAQPLTPADLADLRNELAELAGQLEDFAKLIDKAVEGRLGQLQALMAEADAKVRHLKQLTADSAPGPTTPRAVLTDKIVALATEGLDHVEIARRLAIDVGQVDLTLNLHRRQSAPKAAGSVTE